MSSPSKKAKIAAKCCVVGTGNAAHWLVSSASEAVNWFTPTYPNMPEDITKIKPSITGLYQDQKVTGTPAKRSSDPADVIPGCDLIILPLPSFAMANILRLIAPHLDQGACVVAMPGQGGFFYVAHQELGKRYEDGSVKDVLPWNTRIDEFGSVVRLYGAKRTVGFAGSSVVTEDELKALASRITKVIGSRAGHPEIVPTVHKHHVLITLFPSNQCIHPARMYGLFGHLKKGELMAENPLFYETMDEMSAAMIEEVSDSILAIAAEIQQQSGVDLSGVLSMKDMMKDKYGEQIGDNSTFKTTLATNSGFFAIHSPMIQHEGKGWAPNFHMRYITEDVPRGLIVLLSIAKLLKMDMKQKMSRIVFLTEFFQEHLDKEYIVVSKDKASISWGKDIGETACIENFNIKTVEDLLK